MQYFSFPTSIYFGAGVRHQVREHLETQHVKRPLIVTDRGIASLPILQEFVQRLSPLQVKVFSDVSGNPVQAQVMAGKESYRQHEADAVIGFGGGAALDVAKAVALLATHPGDILEYAYDHPNVRPIGSNIAYLVAIPTTSGTGSEVGRSSVISDEQTHIKKIIFSAHILAKAVFADPELTVDLPPLLTAATGMDALTHNVESYLSSAYHPICDGIALEGARIAGHALRSAVAEPGNMAARSDMMMSSMMGAIAFQKDLGAVHSCAHALSTVADMHHGLANGIMIDHVMRFNLLTSKQKMAELARVCGARLPDHASDEAAAHAFVVWLTNLKEDIGIPARLRDYDGPRLVTQKDILALVDVAVADICHRTNPRPCTRQDFERLFIEAI